MEKIQIMIVALLIIAIIFSTVSIVLNLSLAGFKPASQLNQMHAGNPSGNVNLVVSPKLNMTGGGK